MLSGSSDQFAIEVEVHEVIDGWVFGQFVFHVAGSVVGDPQDQTDLRGCLNWLEALDASAPSRREASLDPVPADVVFRMLYDSVMAGGETVAESERVKNAFSRFHISHVGMSSFNRFDVLLLLRSDGRNRLVWREADGRPKEALLDEGVFNATASETCAYLRPAIQRALSTMGAPE